SVTTTDRTRPPSAAGSETLRPSRAAPAGSSTPATGAVVPSPPAAGLAASGAAAEVMYAEPSARLNRTRRPDPPKKLVPPPVTPWTVSAVPNWLIATSADPDGLVNWNPCDSDGAPPPGPPADRTRLMSPARAGRALASTPRHPSTATATHRLTPTIPDL